PALDDMHGFALPAILTVIALAHPVIMVRAMRWFFLRRVRRGSFLPIAPGLAIDKVIYPDTDVFVHRQNDLVAGGAGRGPAIARLFTDDVGATWYPVIIPREVDAIAAFTVRQDRLRHKTAVLQRFCGDLPTRDAYLAVFIELAPNDAEPLLFLLIVELNQLAAVVFTGEDYMIGGGRCRDPAALYDLAHDVRAKR